MDEFAIDTMSLFVPNEGMNDSDSPPRQESETESKTPTMTPPPRPQPSQHADESITSDTSPTTGYKGFRSRMAAFGGKTSLQDRLMETLLQQVIPPGDAMTSGDDPLTRGYPHGKASAFAQRPNFNITTMSNNFRRFNARIGVVFQFQASMVRLLTWQRPTQTLSFLAIYTFVCIDPYLLAALPPATLLLAVFIPAFLARHPAPPKGTLSSEQSVGFSPRGPPLAPAPTVKPAKELSKDFFRNMRDLQNTMDDFSTLHDRIVALFLPLTNFSDEALSSTLFLGLTLAVLLLTIMASLLPWRLVFLVLGWAALLLSHPATAVALSRAHKDHVVPHERAAASALRSFAARDVLLDSAPETREVEIFELQRRSADFVASGEWEPWLFSPSPHDPLSAPRIAAQRPAGTRFFEDVMPPDGWEWSEKKWALDLWSREWVEERIITGVEVETEGERWVYDMFDERDAAAEAGRNAAAAAGGDLDDDGNASVVDFSSPSFASPAVGSLRGVLRGAAMARRPVVPLPSWEEGEDGEAKRGEWRRRRWVRLVKRRASASDGSA